VPIVVLTDINDENTALSVLGWGAQDCLVKGRFHRELLVRAIHTLSCGSATAIPSAQESPDTLILGAESTLYQAKTQGKNRICHASSN
jgi:DNA-binding NarL/FixJ family response regulator